MTVADPWATVSATADTDSVDPFTGLLQAIADVRAALLDQRETDRIAFCAHHGLDPATFTGCHGCRGTGHHYANGLPCWCAHGAVQLRYQHRREHDDTAALLRIVATKRSGG